MQTIFMSTESNPTPPNAPEPAKKKRGALLFHERMRDEIMWLEIEPGSALDEVALAKKYEVSRTPVREALLLLANEGFVHFLPNRTTVVAPMTLDNTPAFLDTFLLLSRGLVRSVAKLRTARAEMLLDLVDTYREGLGAGEIKRAFQAQLSLYRSLAELSENRFLGKYFLEVQDASVRLKQLFFFPHLNENERQKSVDHLRAVVDAVVAGDADASDNAVVNSIMFEAGVVQRSLGPRFGHTMEIEIQDTPGGGNA